MISKHFTGSLHTLYGIPAIDYIFYDQSLTLPDKSDLIGSCVLRQSAKVEKIAGLERPVYSPGEHSEFKSFSFFIDLELLQYTPIFLQ